MDKNAIDILLDVIGIAIGVVDVIYHKSLGEKTDYSKRLINPIFTG